MKTIGLIGGLSFESTLTYYQVINEYVNRTLGGVHSAKIILYSMEFQEISDYQEKGQWEKEERALINAAKILEDAGADFLLMCCNTTHKFAKQIEDSLGIPLIHIADTAAAVIKSKNISRVGLLGTRFTMEESFYKDRLKEHGIDTIVPEKKDSMAVNDIIFGGLCSPSENAGTELMKAKLLDVISALKNRGAEGIILGCTELGLLICQEEVDTVFGKGVLPLFDTALIHAENAAKLAMK